MRVPPYNSVSCIHEEIFRAHHHILPSRGLIVIDSRQQVALFLNTADSGNLLPDVKTPSLSSGFHFELLLSQLLGI
jgi:hypothetical protein